MSDGTDCDNNHLVGFPWPLSTIVRRMNWTLPNILTVLRLLAAPGVAIMFLYFTRPYADWFALLLLSYTKLSDNSDLGHLKYNLYALKIYIIIHDH